ncbi:MAG TPA: MFS transporter, partial [Actinomycetales bacterium]|nr:MFS transporter [Actinomycetales bacterium]
MPGLNLEPGHSQYRCTLVALFLIGISTFGLMYPVQPLFVTIGADYGRNAAETSLLLSATTLGIALAVIPLAGLSSRIGRARAMQVGLLTATLAGVASAFAGPWWLLVLTRGIVGIGLAFIMVSAMAWVVAEASPWAFGRIGGLYISGTTMGGVLGRLSSGLFAEVLDWRGAILVTSLLALGTGIMAHILLPGSTAPTRVVTRTEVRGPDPNRWFRLRMFLVAGFGMAAFVGTYNVTTYRVAGDPFWLGPGFTGMLFLTYLSGTLTSAVGGRWVQRWGLNRVILAGAVLAISGVLVTLVPSLIAIIGGHLMLAAGFLGLHSVANGGAARYSPAPSRSSAFYTLSYYVGSSVGGVLLGLAWDAGGWPASVASAVALLAVVA